MGKMLVYFFAAYLMLVAVKSDGDDYSSTISYQQADPGNSLIAKINRAFPPEMFAAAYGNTSQLRSLLAKWPQPSDGANVKDWVEQTPLHLAAKFGKLETAKMLLEHGAKVNARNRDFNETPLHLASKSGYIEMVRLLLQHGANADAQIINPSVPHFAGGTPMSYAIETGNSLDTVGLLVQEGSANVNIPNLEMMTPLHLAVKNQNLALIKYLLDSGADMEAKDQQKRSPLNYLVTLKNPPPQLPMIAFLISRGASIETQDEVGRTPLQNAVINGYSVIVKFLIQQGAKIDSRGMTGRTILHRVATSNSPERVENVRMLLRLGADPRIGTPDGCSWPLYDLANANSSDFVNHQKAIADTAKLLLNYGADPRRENPCTHQNAIEAARDNNFTQLADALQNSVDNFNPQFDEERPADVDLAATFSHIGVDKLENIVIMLSRIPKSSVYERDWLNQSALHVASFFGRAYVAMVLTCFGYDIHARDIFGRTPLNNAARIGNTVLIDYFLDRNANIEAVDKDGLTPFLAAVKYSSSPAAVRLLISRGANVSAKETHEGLSALHLAATNQNLEMLEILLAANISANVKTADGRTSLNYLLNSWCCYPQIPTVGILLKYGASVNAADDSGISPLHSAISAKKASEVILLLLYYGADPNAVDKKGCSSPLMMYLRNTIYDQSLSDDEIASTVKWMIILGANPNIGDRCSGSQTPIGLAERSGRTTVVKSMRKSIVPAIEAN